MWWAVTPHGLPYFCLIIITFDDLKNKIHKEVKNTIVKQIFEIEEKQLEEIDQIHYEYLKKKLKEIENAEIEGYIRRTRYLRVYEKTSLTSLFMLN